MNLSRTSSLMFSSRGRGCSISKQSLQHPVQVDTSVESIGKSEGVTVSVLAEIEHSVASVDHRNDVSHDGVDAVELWNLAALAPANADVRVHTASVDVANKAIKPVTSYVSAREQIGFIPLDDGFASRTGHRRDLYAHAADRLGGGDGSGYAHLVGRSAITHAGTLAARLGIVLARVRQAAPEHLAQL